MSRVAAALPPVPLSPTLASRSHPFSAHPHRRSMARPAPLEPPSYPPPMPSLPPAYTTAAMIPAMPPATTLPAYSRRDKPGGETRLAKADRTRMWVQGQGDDTSTDGLQAHGYITDIGGKHPPQYATSPTSPTPAAPTPAPAMAGMPYGFAGSRKYSETEEEAVSLGVFGRALTRSVTNENKGTSAPKRSKSAAAKSVLRLALGRKQDQDDDYSRLDDSHGASFISMGRR